MRAGGDGGRDGPALTRGARPGRASPAEDHPDRVQSAGAMSTTAAPAPIRDWRPRRRKRLNQIGADAGGMRAFDVGRPTNRRPSPRRLERRRAGAAQSRRSPDRVSACRPLRIRPARRCRDRSRDGASSPCCSSKILFETMPMRTCGLSAASNTPSAPSTGRRAARYASTIRDRCRPHCSWSSRVIHGGPAGNRVIEQAPESRFAARLVDRAPSGEDARVQFLEQPRMRRCEATRRP